MNLNNIIYTKDYKFLWGKEILNKNILFLCLGGSHSYGTNVESSDIDIRGVARENINSLLGIRYINYENNDFEVYVDNNTDTTVYALRKLVSLLLSCNPNTIEMLGCKPEHYLYQTNLGQMLIDNAENFLSRRAIYSFGGYATAQLRRLTNALARDAYSQSEKEEHILKTCENVLSDFEFKNTDIPKDSINLHLCDISGNKEICADINLKDFPLRKWQSCLNELHNVVKDYDKLTKRNNKKDELHLNKHAMHLIRLYLTGIDLLEKGKVITYREKDIPLLMDIRNGKYMKPDGTYCEEFFELINDCEKRLKYAADNTCLPDKPNYTAVNDMLIDMSKMEIKVINGRNINGNI